MGQVIARAVRRGRTRQPADRSLRVVRVPAAVLASVYVLSLGAHALGDDGVLAALGCDVVQGYHLSRALPPDEVACWLDARTAAPVG